MTTISIASSVFSSKPLLGCFTHTQYVIHAVFSEYCVKICFIMLTIKSSTYIRWTQHNRFKLKPSRLPCMTSHHRRLLDALFIWGRWLDGHRSYYVNELCLTSCMAESSVGAGFISRYNFSCAMLCPPNIRRWARLTAGLSHTPRANWKIEVFVHGWFWLEFTDWWSPVELQFRASITGSLQ